ncbi:MAG: DNA primase [Candidatus Dojkabacteria bacterium]|nr:DNA primase [Candidatus Dojkabacteria bacterium]
MDENRIQIEEIRNRLDIVDQISKYLELKPAGKNYQGLCPFHTEKTPSFIVSPELQRYKCFGCGEAGDIFNFVQKIEGIDFPETLEKLAKEAGVELKKPKVNSHIAKLYEINKLAGRYYYTQLKKNKEATEYIDKRGFDKNSIYKFAVGYAPGDFTLLEYLQSGDTKFNKKELLDSGLFTLKNSKLRTKFFKRIMFPIRSTSGKVIGFSGRILPGNDRGPKYMNTPETPIYHKKENVFGQYESRKAIRKENLVIFCEGQTDVISAHQFGYENIVAPLGTALTIDQLKNLSKLTKNFLFIFDSDSAGQEAMQRALILISQLNLQAYGASVNPYKDIDEMLQDNPKKLKTLIKNKTDLFSFLLSKKIEDKNPSNYSDINTVLNWVQETLEKISSQSLRSIYLKSLTNTHFFEEEVIRDLRKRVLDGEHFNSFNEEKSNNKSHSNISREEKMLALLLVHEEITIPEDFDLKYFINTNINKILKFIKSHKNVTKKLLLEEDFKQYIEDAIFHFSQLDEKDDMYKLYNLIKKDYYENKERELEKEIAIAETRHDNKESERLLKQFLKLTQEKKNETGDS